MRVSESSKDEQMWFMLFPSCRKIRYQKEVKNWLNKKRVREGGKMQFREKARSLHPCSDQLASQKCKFKNSKTVKFKFSLNLTTRINITDIIKWGSICGHVLSFSLATKDKRIFLTGWFYSEVFGDMNIEGIWWKLIVFRPNMY